MGNAFIPPAPGAYSFLNIVGPNTGQQVKTGPGSLGGVSINTAAAGSVISLFDGTSSAGVAIAAIDGDTQTSLEYGVAFAVGLYIEVTSTPNLTLAFA
jgi:hypothetical protein